MEPNTVFRSYLRGKKTFASRNEKGIDVVIQAYESDGLYVSLLVLVCCSDPTLGKVVRDNGNCSATYQKASKLVKLQ